MKHTEADRQVLLSIFSDVWKDLHGFRPRGILFPSDASYEEIERKLEGLERELAEEIAEERYQEEKTLFEQFYGEELDNREE